MTTPNHHQPFDAEPFSDEERELAARLGRMGAVDGPSPALDAKILAAAHAASVPRKPAKRRALAWLGVPPALVTGVGVAAAAVLVLGVVWQLRPQYGAVTARSEADAGEEIILIAPPADQPAAQVADAAAVPVPAASPAPARSREAKSAPPAAAGSAPKPVAQAAASAPQPAPPPPLAASETGSLAPAAAPATPEAFSGTADAAADARSLDGYAETRARHATYTTAARAEAERRQRSAAQKASANASDTAAAGEEESSTLDRVEVTGSRISAKLDVDWAEIPVSDDTHLASVEWLERIRARRDDGDIDNARASLKLFQREYPRIRLPDDLRTFAEAKQ